jgi:hypothetical protein
MSCFNQKGTTASMLISISKAPKNMKIHNKNERYPVVKYIYINWTHIALLMLSTYIQYMPHSSYVPSNTELMCSIPEHVTGMEEGAKNDGMEVDGLQVVGQ